MEYNQSPSTTLRSDRRTLLRAFGTAGVISLAGCTDSFEEEGEQTLTWLAPASGGTSYALCDEFRRIIEEHTGTDVEITESEETDEERANITNVERLTGSEEFDFAMLRNDVARFAATGTGLEEFEDNPAEDLRGVATLYPEGVHVLTRADAGIQSLEALEGATIDTGALDSATRVNAVRILESVGLSGDDFTERNEGLSGTARLYAGGSRENAERSIGFAQAADGPFTDDVDAAFVIGDWPNGTIEELLETGDVDLLSLDRGVRDAIVERNDWFTENTIPGGTYDAVEEDVETVSVRAMIATRRGTDEEIVGEVTRTIFENTEQIETKREFISSETAMDGMSIEMDPSAEASLEEVDTEGEEDENGDPDEETQESDEESNGTEEEAEEPGDEEDTGTDGSGDDEGADDADDAGDAEDGGDPDGADGGDPDDGAGGDASGTGGGDSEDDAGGDVEDDADGGTDDTEAAGGDDGGNAEAGATDGGPAGDGGDGDGAGGTEDAGGEP